MVEHSCFCELGISHHPRKTTDCLIDKMLDAEMSENRGEDYLCARYVRGALK